MTMKNRASTRKCRTTGQGAQFPRDYYKPLMIFTFFFACINQKRKSIYGSQCDLKGHKGVAVVNSIEDLVFALGEEASSERKDAFATDSLILPTQLYLQSY